MIMPYFYNNRSLVSVLLITLVIAMEVPIRMLLQPDPWLLNPAHWYFTQPLRFCIELVIVLFFMYLLKKYNKRLLTIGHKHFVLLIYSSIAAIFIFSILEFDQLTKSLDTSALNIVLWFATGFCIGLGQELVYRGVVYTSLKAFLSTRLAVIFTTILFIVSPLHSIRLFDLYTQGEIGIVIILVLIYVAVSLLFQWLRNKSGSVLIPGIAHGLGNGITWLAVFS